MAFQAVESLWEVVYFLVYGTIYAQAKGGKNAKACPD
jgi:hypothetical protein